MLVTQHMQLANHDNLSLCLLTAGLLLVKLLPPVMTEPAAENAAPLLTGHQPDSPLASDVALHTDEEPLVGLSTYVTHTRHLHGLNSCMHMTVAKLGQVSTHPALLLLDWH